MRIRVGLDYAQPGLRQINPKISLYFFSTPLSLLCVSSLLLLPSSASRLFSFSYSSSSSSPLFTYYSFILYAFYW